MRIPISWLISLVFFVGFWPEPPTKNLLREVLLGVTWTWQGWKTGGATRPCHYDIGVCVALAPKEDATCFNEWLAESGPRLPLREKDWPSNHDIMIRKKVIRTSLERNQAEKRTNNYSAASCRDENSLLDWTYHTYTLDRKKKEGSCLSLEG